jgi:hypothetical protein
MDPVSLHCVTWWFPRPDITASITDIIMVVWNTGTKYSHLGRCRFPSHLPPPPSLATVLKSGPALGPGTPLRRPYSIPVLQSITQA